jgi:hypothetical protein
MPIVGFGVDGDPTSWPERLSTTRKKSLLPEPT